MNAQEGCAGFGRAGQAFRVLAAVVAATALLGFPRRGGAKPGREVSVGAAVGAPFQVAASASALIGRHRCQDQSPNFCDLAGALVEGRIGTAGATVGLGAGWSLEQGMLGWGVLAGVGRTWRGPLDGPWLAPASRTFYSIEVQGSILIIGHLFAGVTYYPGLPSEPGLWRALFGVGFRLPLLSSYPPESESRVR